ncbi:MAG: DEAD/DEAH box helicase family protein, partial [Nitrososphaeraceae archaeon]
MRGKTFNAFLRKLLVLKATLTYDKGTIVIHGLAHIPFAILDPRTNVLRALALHYSNIIEYLKQSGIEYSDYVFSEETMMLSSSLSSSSPLSLRDYQKKALDNWLRAGLRGCVVLPTGSGKTIIGIRAIEKSNAASLVVVPTLDLMDQWTTTLSKYFPNVRIGNLGGGNDDIQSITVSTYDSAYIRAPFLGNKFSLVIFDEVHHLAALG